jgi:hypothetical protein
MAEREGCQTAPVGVEGLSELHKVGVTNGPGADVSCRNKADASARSERVATDAG